MKGYVMKAIVKAFVEGDELAIEFMKVKSECVKGKKNMLWARIAQCELMNHLHL